MNRNIIDIVVLSTHVLLISSMILDPVEAKSNPVVIESGKNLSIEMQIRSALSASYVPEVYFPKRNNGYKLPDVSSNEFLGTYHLDSNIFYGSGVGSPKDGHGRFNSTYTNPWNVTTNLKYEFDPAAIPQDDNVTNQAISLECRPNRPNPNNPNPNRNWVACMYRGMDSGTGGANGTSINSEIDNDVLNLSSNSATDMEIDVNFNGKVLDGQWSRGLFLSGGGAPGNQTRSIALDIMHVAYDHSWLPWSTGISIRNAENMIALYKTKMDEKGFFLQTFDQNQIETSHLDKNGYLDIRGLRLIESSTPKRETECRKGQVTWDDDNLYLCVSEGRYKKIALSSL